MHDVNSRGPHLAREDLCQRALTELAYREVEMSLPANHRRRGPDQGNRAFARLLHQSRGASSYQEGAEAVVPPSRFECRDLDVDGAPGPEFLEGVDHQVRNSQFIRDRPEQPVDGSLIRRVAGMSGCLHAQFPEVVCDSIDTRYVSRRQLPAASGSAALAGIRCPGKDASSLPPAGAVRWLERARWPSRMGPCWLRRINRRSILRFRSAGGEVQAASAGNGCSIACSSRWGWQPLGTVGPV